MTKNTKTVILVAALAVVAVLAAVIVITFNSDNNNNNDTNNNNINKTIASSGPAADPAASAAASSASSQPEKTVTESESDDPFYGSWIYPDGTRYKFYPDNTGALIALYGSIDSETGSELLTEHTYPYTYVRDGNKLSIDYEDKSFHDAEYTFELKGDKLIMHGGEGTAGGDYELKRVG